MGYNLFNTYKIFDCISLIDSILKSDIHEF